MPNIAERERERERELNTMKGNGMRSAKYATVKHDHTNKYHNKFKL